MEYSRPVIEAKSLPKGIHCFTFPVQDAFFAEFENTEILHASLTTDVEINKSKEDTPYISVEIKGDVVLLCDRCLGHVTVPVFHKGVLTGEETEECTDLATGSIDLTQYIYDYVCLALPIRRVHLSEEICSAEVPALWKHQEEKENFNDTAFSGLKDLIKK
ncbi:MAG: YceD family protein [Bacteroidales bacterium]